MIKLGDYNLMEVERFTASGVYLRSGEQEALLPRKFVDPALKPGDNIEVFLFTDSEDRLTATTQKPKAKVDEFAYLMVVDTNQYGAFMDWGLDKDLLVPFSEQKEKMEKRHKYIVRIALDHKTNRLVGISKLRDFFKTDVSSLTVGQKVDLLVFGETDLGIKVIIDNQYEGLLYKNEVFEPLSEGERTIGYIKKIREDGKLDVTIYKAGMEGVKTAEDIILNRLRFSGGYLPYNDSTPPDTIREELMMSKKVFKKAIGSLYKHRIITFQDDGFVLNEAHMKQGSTQEDEKSAHSDSHRNPDRNKQSSFSGKDKNKPVRKGSEEKRSLQSRIVRKKEGGEGSREERGNE
jgi:uncharacterized protein